MSILFGRDQRPLSPLSLTRMPAAVLLWLAVASSLVFASRAHALTYTVNSSADAVGPAIDCAQGPTCTLRDAVARAVGGDTIVFAPGVATITVTTEVVFASTGQLAAVTVDGGGAVTVSGGGATRVLRTEPGTITEIRGLKIVQGAVSGFSGTQGNGAGILNAGQLSVIGGSFSNNVAASSGGAVYNDGGQVALSRTRFEANSASFGGAVDNGKSGTLVLDACELSRNEAAFWGAGLANTQGTVTVRGSRFTENVVPAQALGASGAAVVNLGTMEIADSLLTDNSAFFAGGGIANSGTLSVVRSTLRGNKSTSGGGIYNMLQGMLTVERSTLANNRAEVGDGGGIHHEGTERVTVLNSTLHANVATVDPFRPGLFGSGGGIYNKQGLIVVQDSTLSGNVAVNGAAIFNNSNAVPAAVVARSIIDGTCNAALSDGLGNLESATSCGLTAAGSRQNAALHLGPLQDNGGPTHTVMPQAGSDAIDFAACPVLPGPDQRGVRRPLGGNCDSGAVEVRSGPMTLSLAITGAGSVTASPQPTGAGSSGGIAACTSAAPCSATYAGEFNGASVTLTAVVPASHVVSWSGDCTAAAGQPHQATVTMDGAKSCAAAVVATHAITGLWSPAQGGQLQCPATVLHGAAATCTAAPASGYVLQSFSGCDAVTGTVCTLSNVQSARVVTAQFTRSTYPITQTISPPGSGSWTSCPSPVTHGASASCTAAAAPGFRFDRFTGCDASAPAAGGNVCTLASVESAKTITAHFAPITTFAATTVPSSGAPGPAEASFTGGGATCRFDAAGTRFVAAPSTPPAGQTLPQGMFEFKLVGCDVGSTITMSVKWPQPVSGYTKYGPPALGALADYFHPSNLSITGTTATFDVTDGLLGDDDWQKNGSIADPTGPTAPALIGARGIPTLGEWSLALLSLLAGVFGAMALRRRMG